MLSKIFQLLPTTTLAQIHNAAFGQLTKRGCPLFSDPKNEVYVSEYNGFTIKIEAVPLEDYTCLYSIYSGETLLKEGGDYCSNMGESELEARKWIDGQELPVIVS